MATILFDLNGTLLDPSVLAAPLGGGGAGRALVFAGLDDAIGQAMALTLAGGYAPLPELLRAALRRRLALGGNDEALADAAVERLATMPPFPDAADALDRLELAGHRAAVVTNSARASAEAVLDHAGLLDRFVAVVGTDEVRAFKPDARVYRHALARLGAAPEDCWLVAAHWWDVLGAARVGLRTAWVARREERLLETVHADVTGTGLVDAVAAIPAA